MVTFAELGEIAYLPKVRSRPDDYRSEKLPGSLRLVSSDNRKIYLDVINFDAAKRVSAKQWLESLKMYKSW